MKRSLVCCLAAATLAAGCSNGSLVVVTVGASTPMPEVAKLTVSALAGGRTRTLTAFDTPGGIPPERSIGVDVPPNIGGTFAVYVQALDGAGQPLASAQGEVALKPGARVDLPI